MFDRPARLQSEPFPAPAVTITGARDAFEAVLASAGATKPRRDSVDARVASAVRSGAGRIIDKPSDVGGWPAYAAGAALPDSDRDGIPDAWEVRRGLSPRDAKNAGKTAPSGYTWIEEYLNDLGRVQ